MVEYIVPFLCLMSVAQCYKYCVIGAGPGGVQIGFYLQKLGRDYIIFERSNQAGSFFEKYPRHRKLISINKRHTGSTNKEFNLRHDWNSLLGDDDQMLFKEFSKEMFPPADSYISYINTYASYYKLNIRYNIEIKNIRKMKPMWFLLEDQHNNITHCNIVIVATGLSLPFKPNVTGIELTDGYEDISTFGPDYEGKSVLILGRGNSAFETAQAIYDRTNYVHMIGRHRIRLAWETHYVGDIRAINNEILDTYQLKSLDGFLEYGNLEDYMIVRKKDGLYLTDADEEAAKIWGQFENDPLQKPYDQIIRCLGFRFDTSIFSNQLSGGYKGKYPLITPDYQSTDIPGIYIVGTATHSLDHRKSAGGFIHGFRYSARALNKILSWRYHSETWPKQAYSISNLLPVTVKRINEASGIYQMFGQLVDVILINSISFEYYEEFPVNLIREFGQITGESISNKSMIVLGLEYGEDYHGPSEDVFREDRAATEPRYAHLSNFLHPVLYFYHVPPKRTSYLDKRVLPIPDKLFHLVEDFHTNWHHNKTHVQHLKTFLENCLSQRLDAFQNTDCLSFALSRRSVPVTCYHYLKNA
ncbi:FAD-dependent oxidoreductase domain-containing protein 2-like isoform X1 [Mytilus galloprovincialis]|uniref:FAD-dependent oxidoreductase domain-containing protein 2-like isoform X1 n=1 Tax=Mytilus galloprovincialis TaxID=29158 RepID=UPI003F7C8F56